MSHSSAIGDFSIGFSPIEGAVAAQPTLANTAINRLYDNVQAVLPGVTLPIIDLCLWNTVEEFCIRGTYFRSRVFWQMAEGVSSVDFDPFSASMVVQWVYNVLGLVNWAINPPGQLVDMAVPSSTRNGSAILVIKPVSYDAVKAGVVPILFTTWFETMLDGVFFRLYGQPAKPWSSPQLAQYHGHRFRQGLNRARDIAERLYSDQQSPWNTYPYFARGRRKQ